MESVGTSKGSGVLPNDRLRTVRHSCGLTSLKSSAPKFSGRLCLLVGEPSCYPRSSSAIVVLIFANSSSFCMAIVVRDLKSRNLHHDLIGGRRVRRYRCSTATGVAHATSSSETKSALSLFITRSDVPAWIIVGQTLWLHATVDLMLTTFLLLVPSLK